MALRRGVGLVIGLLVFATLTSVAGMAAIWLLLSREPSVARNSTLVLRLDTDLRESPGDDVFELFAGDSPQTLRGVVEQLRKAKVDKRIESAAGDRIWVDILKCG